MSSPGEHPSTRELIVAVAVRCFADHGYDGTSLNDIAAAVGIRRPSVLHHFASKDALYEEVFERLLSDFLARAEEAAAADLAGWAKLESVLAEAFRFFAAHPDYVRLMRREAIDGGVRLGIDLGAVLRPMFDAASGFLRAEMASGRFRPQDPDQLLISLYGMLFTYFSDSPLLAGLLAADPMDPAHTEAHLSHLLTFFRAALVPEARGTEG